MTRSGVLAKAVRVEPRPADARTDPLLEVAGAGAELTVCRADGTSVPLPQELVEVLTASATELAKGHAVTVLPSEVLLSPAEVAKLLGLSRPFVARLLDQGQIPAEHLPASRHRRVRLSDVLAFQERRESRRAGRRQVADAIEAAGLPYDRTTWEGSSLTRTCSSPSPSWTCYLH